MTSQKTNGCVLCFNLTVIFTAQLISWAVKLNTAVVLVGVKSSGVLAHG